MRQEINMMLGDEPAPERSFRKPLATTDETGRTKTAAWLLHTHVCEILEAAEMADLLRRHECGWKAHVHRPVLGLVFSSLLSRAGFRPQQSHHVIARYEAVQAATITKESAPHWEDGGPAVTVSSTEPSEDDSAECYEKPEPIPDRSRSKRVDYVVVLRIVDDKPLQQAIRRAAFNDETKTCYVNQTAYNPIFDAPIAVSIKTKETSSNDDSMVQLSLWVAAWHKRMSALRQRSFPSPPVSWLPDSMSVNHDLPPPLLVSVPLIEAVGHEWKLYFACDSVSSISLYGPVTLGSTTDVLDLYALVTCLLLIQDWVESTFYEGMRTWFLHDYDYGDTQNSTQAQ
ncbi:hypothetical protein GGR51DRAFT_514986 [Nemania sp. FL0031]|nr:hypothetical protein GGR51DRAFT_514986 [Nemania sp. FL0031]